MNESAVNFLPEDYVEKRVAGRWAFFCIGLNYSEHAAEAHETLPDFPVVFAKFSNCVIGPGDAIVHPKISVKVDYEAELGVVIGRRAK